MVSKIIDNKIQYLEIYMIYKRLSLLQHTSQLIIVSNVIVATPTLTATIAVLGKSLSFPKFCSSILEPNLKGIGELYHFLSKFFFILIFSSVNIPRNFIAGRCNITKLDEYLNPVLRIIRCCLLPH